MTLSKINTIDCYLEFNSNEQMCNYIRQTGIANAENIPTRCTLIRFFRNGGNMVVSKGNDFDHSGIAVYHISQFAN